MEQTKDKHLLNQSLDQVMSDRFGKYSKYIIQDRALPDARDGLKPVQRRILYSMHDLGLFFNKAFKKSARVVGDVIGKYHPHGDSSIYEALVRMSQPWKTHMPLIEMHGNNGSIDDDPAAAMRYTESRLAQISNLLLKDIKKNTVLFAPNFDDSELEPTVLPGLFPNLLVNGAKGIAAGYATEMPPHNLSEVVHAIIARIKNPRIRLDQILKHITGPDFPTGGIVKGKSGIYQAFERGRGRIMIRSQYILNTSKTHPSIQVTAIPYGVVKAKLVKEIDEIRYQNKINGIKDVRDESDRTGLSIMIELAAHTDVEAVLSYLLAKTELQVYYNYNNIAIKDKMPTQMGLLSLIEAYLKHQHEVQTRAIKNDLTKNQKRLEIVQGLLKVTTIAEQVIATIRQASGSRQGVVKALVATFAFTELQAGAIADLRLYRLSQTDQATYLEEKKQLEQDIKWATHILGDPAAFDQYLIKLLTDLEKTYGQPRRTIIDGEIEAVNVDMDALVRAEQVWVGISKDGYLKRFSNRSYEANEFHAYGLRENDVLRYFGMINTKDKLLIFTAKGHYLLIPVHSLSETKFKDVGKHVNDFATLSKDDYVVSVINVTSFQTNAFVVIATQQGRIKKTKLSDFDITRYNKLYKAFNLKPGEHIVGAQASNGFQQIILITKQGMATKYSETQLPVQGTKASGIKGLILKNTHVSALAVVSGGDTLGLASNRGGLKRIRVVNIAAMARTTQGRPLYRMLVNEPHHVLVAAVVEPQTPVVFFSKKTFKSVLFNTTEITTAKEGFSLIGPKRTHGAMIQTFVDVDPKNPLFQAKSAPDVDKQFDQAAQAVADIEEINIDDILKNMD